MQILIQLNQFFSEALSAGQKLATIICKSPILEAAQPAIAALGILFAGISGYEIGHTIVLKAKGQWHPSLARPVILLTATVALAALSIVSTPYVAIAIASVAALAFITGAIRAHYEKGSAENLDFQSFQDKFGAMPPKVIPQSPKEFLKLDHPTQNDACNLVWHLMKSACDHGDSFAQGTFVLEGMEAQGLYDKLSSIKESYTRESSHFKGRCALPQKGLDFSDKNFYLPGEKRTILFGLAKSHDNKTILFIKPENWGADHRFSSLLYGEGKIKHFINHTFSFIHAQYVKILRPGYDDQPGSAKERIPHSWKSETNVNKFGWAALSLAEKDILIKKKLAKEAWKEDTYRTGQEIYLKI